MLNIKEAAEWLGGDLRGSGQVSFHYLLSDSRSYHFAADALFICLEGVRHDGHLHIEEMIVRGCRAFIVNRKKVPNVVPEGVGIILVDDTLQALQKLAAVRRSLFTGPVIGITGSNGKTIVKEWLSQLLDPDYHICKSPKSYNSQVGVPLSVWPLNQNYQIGLFEAGISQPGEMEKLERIIQPTTGIFTHLGSAHDGNFSSRKQKAFEKSRLFLRADTIIFCRDQTELWEIFNTSDFAKKRLLTWSENGKADLRIIEIKNKGLITRIKGDYFGAEMMLTLPLQDRASIENGIVCWLQLLSMGYKPHVIQKRMEGLAPLSMRMQVLEGEGNCTLLNDTYSNDIQSLGIALNFLQQQKQHAERVVILSDILQTGLKDDVLIKNVNEILEAHGTTLFIGVGPRFSKGADFFSMKKMFFADTDILLKALDNSDLLPRDAAILIKGARVYGFERVLGKLQQKSHETVLEINLQNLVHNLNHIRSKLKPGTKLMPMVKAYSYGSGEFDVANTLSRQNVDYLAVAYADEGVALRLKGIRTPIMVMNPEQKSFGQLLRYQLEPEIFSIEIFSEVCLFWKNIRKSDFETLPIHLKLDTGMHRLGFRESELKVLISELKKAEFIKIKSVLSHLAAAEDSLMDEFTIQQIAAFEKMCAILQTACGYPFLKHICNSAGIHRFPQAHFDMVRPGIGLYGLGMDDKDQNELLPVHKLRTKISQIKLLKKGDTVGYGRRGIISGDTLVATLPIGYADGVDRRLGNGAGGFFVKGKRATTIGNICMDMCMIDISGTGAAAGDEVVWFDSIASLRDISSILGTIPYEILTSVSARIKRIYISE